VQDGRYIFAANQKYNQGGHAKNNEQEPDAANPSGFAKGRNNDSKGTGSERLHLFHLRRMFGAAIAGPQDILCEIACTRVRLKGIRDSLQIRLHHRRSSDGSWSAPWTWIPTDRFDPSARPHLAQTVTMSLEKYEITPNKEGKFMSNIMLRLVQRTIYLTLFYLGWTLLAAAAGRTNITGTWNLDQLE